MTTENEDLNRGDEFTPVEGVDSKELKQKLELEELAAAKKAADDKAAEDKAKDEEVKDEVPAEAKKEDEAEDKKADDEDKERSKVIPRERFDKAQAKAKAREEALQQKIADLEKQTAGQRMSADTKKISDAVDALEEKYEELILDGKGAEAKAVRKELKYMRDALIDAKTTLSTEAAKREAIQELKFDAALAKAESDHPELNPDSEEFDEALTDEVAVLLESFVLRGFTRDTALQKAVKYVVGPVAKKDADNVDPKKVEAERAAAARRKSAEAMKKQPSPMNGGLDSDKAGKKDDMPVDIMRMNQDRFAKLDEDILSKMRGDTL